MPTTPTRSLSNRQNSPGRSVSKTFLNSSMTTKDPSIVQKSTGFRSPAQSASSGQQSAEFVIKDNNIISRSPTMRSGLPGASKREASLPLPFIAPSSKQPTQSTPTPQQADGLKATAPEKPLDLNTRTGTKFELCFGLAAFFVFMSLWVYVMTIGCYELQHLIFYLKTLPMIGAFTGLFVAIYSCFERNTTPRRGLTGCLFFTMIGLIGILNLIGAYLTVFCPCKCRVNPIANPGPDLAILVLEVVGSICLLSTLLVVSLTR